MVDSSHLDNKYFIDKYVYNCPFCNRRNVSYGVTNKVSFNWTNSKECYVYITECSSCNGQSMHLSYEDISTYRMSPHAIVKRFDIDENVNLDAKFFYSVPTSFFSLDKRIPKVLRELYIEAEGCIKSNFLTGASACVRKIIYELAIIEKAEGDNYDSRIKSLKEKRNDVEPEFFDTLLTIQQLTSQKVHEKSYDGWESQHLLVLLSTLNEILSLMYVIPEVRKEKRSAILNLKKELNEKESKNIEKGGEAA